jgi:dTMP kinase
LFIDFEGIDGSGKTTLSNKLAKRLRAAGYVVSHAREGGELKAPIARRLRELTRDQACMEMSPRCEFLLNLARDAQQLEQVIKPALARGEVCITDRYVYSQLALTGGGRGLLANELEPVLAVASQGIWPDLVILVDVDPELSRLRKRLGKLGSERSEGGGSRKGLIGAGLNVRVRASFLQQARRDPGRWLVVENNDQPLEALADRVYEVVRARLDGRRAVLPTPSPTPPAAAATLANLDETFYAAIDEVLGRETKLGLFLLTGIPGPAAHHRRLGLLEKLPQLVARSLSGLHDESAWALREVLELSAPEEVLRSIGSDPSPEPMALREKLFDGASSTVVCGLRRNDSPAAWRLRERALAKGELEAVLSGLSFVDSPAAWELRRAGMREGLVAATARSLHGLVGDAADALREHLYPKDRLATLRSVTGLDTPLARRLREQLFGLALKVVMRSLSGVDAPYAWQMRAEAITVSKEALDSVDGMDTEQAWALREGHWEAWPSTAVSSLRQLALTRRGEALIEAVLTANPRRIAVVRNAYAAIARAPLRLCDEQSQAVALEAP